MEEANRTINILSAENERNRIGRDLHDTLGHTFAMMSLKTELALKQMDKEQYDAARKNLEELNQLAVTPCTRCVRLSISSSTEL